MSKFLTGVAAVALMAGWAAGIAHANPTLKKVTVENNYGDVEVGTVYIDVDVTQTINGVPDTGDNPVASNESGGDIEVGNVALISENDFYAVLVYDGDDENIDQTEDVGFDDLPDGGPFNPGNFATSTGVANINQLGASTAIYVDSNEAAASLSPPSQGSGGNQTILGGGLLGGLF